MICTFIKYLFFKDNALKTGPGFYSPGFSPTDVRALTNITLCYYLGDDVLKSHLQFNKDWVFTLRNLKGLYTYINQLTLGANKILGKIHSCIILVIS